MPSEQYGVMVGALSATGHDTDGWSVILSEPDPAIPSLIGLKLVNKRGYMAQCWLSPDAARILGHRLAQFGGLMTKTEAAWRASG